MGQKILTEFKVFFSLPFSSFINGIFFSFSTQKKKNIHNFTGFKFVSKIHVCIIVKIETHYIFFSQKKPNKMTFSKMYSILLAMVCIAVPSLFSGIAVTKATRNLIRTAAKHIVPRMGTSNPNSLVFAQKPVMRSRIMANPILPAPKFPNAGTNAIGIRRFATNSKSKSGGGKKGAGAAAAATGGLGFVGLVLFGPGGFLHSFVMDKHAESTGEKQREEEAMLQDCGISARQEAFERDPLFALVANTRNMNPVVDYGEFAEKVKRQEGLGDGEIAKLFAASTNSSVIDDEALAKELRTKFESLNGCFCNPPARTYYKEKSYFQRATEFLDVMQRTRPVANLDLNSHHDRMVLSEFITLMFHVLKHHGPNNKQDETLEVLAENLKKAVIYEGKSGRMRHQVMKDSISMNPMKHVDASLGWAHKLTFKHKTEFKALRDQVEEAFGSNEGVAIKKHLDSISRPVTVGAKKEENEGKTVRTFRRSDYPGGK